MLAAQTKPKRTLIRSLFVAGLLLLCVLGVLAPQLFTETTAVTSFAANAAFGGNLHEVVPGRFYRSAELDQQRLVKTIEHYQLKSIIDLRLGDDNSFADGRSEEDIAREHSVAYYHVRLQGSRADQPERLQELLRAYDQAAAPVLVHCTSGTHRSGVAAAVWLLDKEGASIDVAAAQLSPKYGYFHWERRLKSLIQGHGTIDELLWQYQQANAAQAISFRDWLAQRIKQENKAN